ncbi:hypothetical protein ACICHK_24120 [Streptomyces sp. AHU1]|uniref:hypothetical protein n=1 Tax=Streptomyces sp. AHU1 TaxID=3377215 RepID=UPI003877D7F7
MPVPPHVDSDDCDGTPGLCWCCEPDKERRAEISSGRYDEYDPYDGDDEDREDHEDDDRWILGLVNAYPGGMGEEPAFDLSDELPPGFQAHSIQALTLLTEVARRRLDTEGWENFGPWGLDWVSCEGVVTGLRGEGEDVDCSGDASDREPVALRRLASITNDDAGPTLQVVETGMGIRRTPYRERVSGCPGESPDTDTLDELRDFLARATERLGEAGYETDGEWTVNWSRCHVQLDDN